MTASKNIFIFLLHSYSHFILKIVIDRVIPILQVRQIKVKKSLNPSVLILHPAVSIPPVCLLSLKLLMKVAVPLGTTQNCPSDCHVQSPGKLIPLIHLNIHSRLVQEGIFKTQHVTPDFLAVLFSSWQADLQRSWLYCRELLVYCNF